MSRHLLFAASLLVSGPALAQDAASDALSSAGSYAGTVAVNSHLRRSADGASKPRISRESRVACAGKARYRERWGADDPRTMKLYRLCRTVGR